MIKLAATRAHGAEVVLHGNSYDDAYDAAIERSLQTNAPFIHAFDGEAVIAGQGTLGLEILTRNPALDVIVVPVGGSELIVRVGCAVKGQRPQVEVVGVQRRVCRR